jgi:hypothetical protein
MKVRFCGRSGDRFQMPVLPGSGKRRSPAAWRCPCAQPAPNASNANPIMSNAIPIRALCVSSTPRYFRWRIRAGSRCSPRSRPNAGSAHRHKSCWWWTYPAPGRDCHSVFSRVLEDLPRPRGYRTSDPSRPWLRTTSRPRATPWPDPRSGKFRTTQTTLARLSR